MTEDMPLTQWGPAEDEPLQRWGRGHTHTHTHTHTHSPGAPLVPQPTCTCMTCVDIHLSLIVFNVPGSNWNLSCCTFLYVCIGLCVWCVFMYMYVSVQKCGHVHVPCTVCVYGNI